jgi:hypothetical protein
VVVDLREADVLVREEPQLLDRGLDAGRAAGNALEQMAQLFLVYRDAS